jgi:sortase A
MSFRRVLNLLGKILVTLGVLLLLFTAFQLWGTNILQSRSQDALRSTFDKEVRHVPAAPAAVATHGPPAVAPAASAPAEGQPVGIIQIPSIGLNQVVVEGVGTPDLRQGPGHYPGTPLPGQRGNVAIAGHRTTYGHPFYNLDAVPQNGRVVLLTRQGVFVYRTQSITPVSPTDTSVLDPSAQALLTLTTCNPRFSASQRLILRARLTASLLYGPGNVKQAAPSPSDRAPSTFEDGGSSDWLPAVLWGLLVAVLAAGALLLARRTGRRLLVYGVAVPVLLIVLFFFFAALSPLLPASF